MIEQTKVERQLTQQELDTLRELKEKGKAGIERDGDKFNIQEYYDQINGFWMDMGTKYGIDWSTVEASARGEIYFLADLLKVGTDLTPLEEEALITFLAKDLYVPPTTKNQLVQIIEQLEEGCFSSESRSLIEKDLGFIAMRKLSQSEVASSASYTSLIVPMTVRRSLKKIYDYLEEGEYYSTEGVPIESYPAFLLLKRMA